MLPLHQCMYAHVLYIILVNIVVVIISVKSSVVQPFLAPSPKLVKGDYCLMNLILSCCQLSLG